MSENRTWQEREDKTQASPPLFFLGVLLVGQGGGPMADNGTAVELLRRTAGMQPRVVGAPSYNSLK